MIIPVRCFTCGKVSDGELSSIFEFKIAISCSSCRLCHCFSDCLHTRTIYFSFSLNFLLWFGLYFFRWLETNGIITLIFCRQIIQKGKEATPLLFFLFFFFFLLLFYDWLLVNKTIPFSLVSVMHLMLWVWFATAVGECSWLMLTLLRSFLITTVIPLFLSLFIHSCLSCLIVDEQFCCPLTL